jgi:hypothetical protein
MPDLSLKNALQSFEVPLTSARALAARYVVDYPVSLRHLLSASDLVMASQTFHLALDADTVAGWTEVEIWADGQLGFRGHVHESGALSHHFQVIAVIEVMVDIEVPLICTYGGAIAWVHGTAGLGSRDNDWSVTEYTAARHRLAELWDVVRGSPESSVLFNANLTVVEITEALAALVVARGLAITAEQLANRVAIALK